MKHKIYILIFSFVLLLSVGSFEQVTAQISGKVIDATGKPIEEILVELIPLETQSNIDKQSDFDSLTDENGFFEFEDIKNGKYILAIGYIWTPDIDDPYPTTFYPRASEKSQALVFEIKSGEKVQDILFQLPPKLPELNVKGKVILNGKPAVDAHVRLHNKENNLIVSDCRTDLNGNFFLKGFVGGKYRIEADTYRIMVNTWESAHSEDFTLDKNRKGFQLILKSIEKN